MFGTRITLSKANKDEAEKPFWISYADMMTALMVLFLVVMSVTLLAVSKKSDQQELGKKHRAQEIQKLCDEVEKTTERFEGVKVTSSPAPCVINFGPRAYFKVREYSISAETASRLRAFIHEILKIIREPWAKKWVKHVVIEGHASETGNYLYNLDLSLKRSHRVLCVLLEQDRSRSKTVTKKEQEELQQLFLVGGYSFNAPQQTLEASRRVELRLEFLGLDEQPKRLPSYKEDIGKCQLN